MGILEELQNYVTTKSKEDLGLIQKSLLDRLPAMQTPLITGGSKKRTKKRGGSTQPFALNDTRKNKDQVDAVTKNKITTKILLAILVLSSISGLRKLLPPGTDLIQVLTIYGNEGYEKVMVPFMLNMDSSFTFLKTNTLPNVTEGLYTKAIATLNGTDMLTDPNRFFATLGNIIKVCGWMDILFSGILNLTFTPKVPPDPPLSDKEVEALLRELLKTLNEKVKGIAGYTYMVVPPGSVLMIRNQESPKTSKDQPPGMFASQPEPVKM